jgi:uncharacterized protein
MSQQPSFATPVPAFMGALAVTAFLFGALFLGMIKMPEGLVFVATWLLGVFVVFLPASLICLKDGDLPGGNVFLLFTGFFILTSALGFLAKYFMIRAGIDFAAAGASVDAWGWLACAGFLIIVTPAFLKAPKLFLILVALVDVALVCIVGMNFGKLDPALGSKIAGSLLMIVGWMGVYLAGAITCNTVHGKSILPIV